MGGLAPDQVRGGPVVCGLRRAAVAHGVRFFCARAARLSPFAGVYLRLCGVAGPTPRQLVCLTLALCRWGEGVDEAEYTPLGRPGLEPGPNDRT